MSDVGLGASLQLDIAEALSRIDALAASIDAVTTGVAVTLDTPDATPITAAIDDAVAAADVSVEPEADGTGVTDAIDAAIDAADTTVPVDADTAAAQAEIAGLDADAVTVPVDADTSAADAEIASTIAQAEADDIVLSVTADTGDAEAAIDSVGDSAVAAQGGVAGLAKDTQALSGGFGSTAAEGAGLAAGIKALSIVQTTASGSAAGLGSALGGISVGSAAAVGGVGAVVATLGSFFQAGLKVTESKERFQQTFGALADGVKSVHVGTLNGELGDLSLELGTSTSRLRDAASNIGQFGEAAGRSAPDVAAAAEQVLALSLRARALNPALGESGDIAISLAGALARGGRALAPYGIALTAAEIQARALTDTGKSLNSELTQFDKLAAGAAIAAERLGPTLGETVAQGGEKAGIQLERIGVEFARLKANVGEPLVSPVLELLQNLAPIGLTVGTIFGDVIGILIPFVEVLGEIAGPIATIVDQVTALDPAVVSLAAGLGLAAFGLNGLSTAALGLTATNPLLAAFAATVGIAVAGVAAFRVITGQADEAKFKQGVTDATAALKDQDGQIRLNIGSITNYLAKTEGFDGGKFKTALDVVHIGLRDVVADLLDGADGQAKFNAALDGMATQNIVVNGTVVRLSDEYRKLQKELEGVATNGLVAAEASGSISAAQLEAALAADSQIEALRRLQPEIDAHAAAIKTATAVYQPLIDVATNSVTALQAVGTESTDVERALVGLIQGGVAPSDASLLNLATTLDRAQLSTDGFGSAAASLGVTANQLTTFVDSATGALQDFIQSTVDGLPTVGDAFKDAIDVAGLTKNLNDSIVAVTQFQADLEAIFQAGGADLSAVLAQQGVEGGGAFARELAASIHNGTSALVTDTEATVDATNHAIEGATEYLVTTFGPRYIAQSGLIASLAAEAFSGTLSFADKTRLAAELATSTLDDSGKAIAVIAANKGAEAAQAYADLFKIDDKTVAAGIAAANAITGVAPTVVGAAGALGAAAATGYENTWSTLPALTATGVAGAAAAITTGTPSVTGASTSLGTQAVTGYENTWSTLPALTATGVAGAAAAVNRGGPAVTAAASATGAAAGAGYGSKVTAGMAAGSDAASIRAKVVLQAQQVALTVTASAVGGQVGQAFSTGMAAGIAAKSGVVQAAARKVVADAEAAAKARAGIKSPSTVWAEMGRNLGAGLEGGLSESAAAVIAAAEAIIDAASAAVAQGQLPAPDALVAASQGFGVAAGVDAAGGTGQPAGATITIGDITIQVPFVPGMTHDELDAAGRAFSGGFTDGLIDRLLATEIRLNSSANG